MKYLFVVQGEGRGHLTQALALSDLLRRNGHEVGEVLVGRCKNREIPQFFVDKIGAQVTMFDSPSLDYGRVGKGGAVVPTLVKNLGMSKINKWRRSIKLLSLHITESDADVVISFYEFLLCFVQMLRPLHKPVIAIGHQFLVDHPNFKHRSKGLSNARMLQLNNMICSYGVMRRLALSFYPMESVGSHTPVVVPPLLRPEIFDLEPTQGDYLLGYMLNPGYLSEVLEWKSRHPESKVHLFWDKSGAAECEERVPGLWLHRINDEKFLHYMAGCRGYITTAGFESICEAMYLGKPVLMIPAHLEQSINADDASSVGAGRVSAKFNLSKLESAIRHYSADTESFRRWVQSGESILLGELTKL
ncbi:MAG: glycosyltransferase family protein [Rikenellaceae bacterium]